MRRRFSFTARLAAAIAVVLSVALVAAWMMQPDRTAGPCVVVEGPSLLAAVPEASGLAVSRHNRGLLWTHNDSGSAAVLFAIDTTGHVRGRVRVPVVTRDWEDVSVARCLRTDCVYIADIGDNRGTRPRIQIYRVPEPAATDTETAAPETFSATYADGPHNAEAMFVSGSDLFIVTRDRTGGVYRATIRPESRDLTFERVGELGLAAVSDAETSPDEKSVIVRTSHDVVVYRTADVVRGATVPSLRIPIDGLKEAQGEGVAVDGTMLYLASEGRPWNKAGRLLALRCEFPQSLVSMSLFSAQRHHRVDVAGTSRGQVRRGGGHYDEDQRRANERQRIEWRHPKQHSANVAGEDDRDGQPECDADGGQTHTATKHQANDVSARRTKGDADSCLRPALRGRVRRNAVQSNRCQSQGKDAEQS